MSGNENRDDFSFGGFILKILFALSMFFLILWFIDWYGRATLAQRKKFWNWTIGIIILLWLADEMFKTIGI